MPRRRLAALAPLLLLLSAVASDVIFRVPEVVVRHAANTKAVGTGRANSSRNEQDPYEGLLEVRYEEYFVEHEISTPDARKAAMELRLDEIPSTLPGCGTCTKRELQYCETRVLADHCCCERRSFPEPFPWLPHTCYMGQGRCKPLVHDCAKYKRLRDCCCYRKLAERWQGILSRSSRMGVSGVSLLLLSMLLFVAYL